MLRGGSAVPSSRPTWLFASSSRLLRQTLIIFANHHARRTLKTVAEVVAPISIEDFRRDAFQAQKPLLIRSAVKELPTSGAITRQNVANTSTSPTILPALAKWFTTSPTTGKASLTPYLDTFRSTILQYELSSPNSAQFSDFISWLQSSSHDPESEDSQSRLALLHLLRTYLSHHSLSSDSEFLILDLPLHLLLLAHQYNNTSTNPPLTNIYIAQTPLSSLPPPLQSDLPTPILVTYAGRGDIYSSSIWLGLQPTYTPWHRDPNPNLFVQLCGTKKLRMMPPKRGEGVFRRAAMMISRSTSANGNGNGNGNTMSASARLRGEEMMKGVQRRVLEEVVWGSDTPKGARYEDGEEGLEEDMTEKMMYEVTVRTGDMLFMPLGWWHSVKSVGEEGGINGSVNWWFR